MDSYRSHLWICALVSALLLFPGCGFSGDSNAPERPLETAEGVTLEGVESGELSIKLTIQAPRREEEVTMQLFGDFLPGRAGLPQLDFSISSEGELKGRAIDSNIYLLMAPGRAAFSYGPRYYRIDRVTLTGLISAFEQAQEEEGPGNIRSCQRAAAEIDFSRIVIHLSQEGHEIDLAGSRVTSLSGELNPSAGIDALIELGGNPGCGSQLAALAPGLIDRLAEAKQDLVEDTQEARIKLGVDKNDVIRDLSLVWWIGPQTRSHEELKVELVMYLSKPLLHHIPLGHETKPLGRLLKGSGLSLQEVREVTGSDLMTVVLRAIGQKLAGVSGP